MNDSENSDFLFKPVPITKFQTLTQAQLIEYIQGQQGFIDELSTLVNKLRKEDAESRERTILLGEQFVILKRTFFGKSSERVAAPATETGADIEDVVESTQKKIKRTRIRLPSERYPDAPLIEEEVLLQDPPPCQCCGEKLTDSGMTEDLEFITKIPEQFFVVRQKKHKYKCKKCHGDIQTAPTPPRVKEGSAYSDEMIVDTAVKKFCDLIPIERQTKMAERAGFAGLPPQSLIETTHYLADFLKPIYEKIKLQTLNSPILHADETPHKMLEGDKTSHWYFWGFSSQNSAYFEAHGTRSGDVAVDVLKHSKCRYLMSDVYTGYQKAVRLANEERQKLNLPRVQKIYCNAHARRKFKDAEDYKIESDYFIRQYQRIYLLESDSKEKPPDQIKENRLKMKLIFEEMRIQALSWLNCFSTKSSITIAMNYFLKNFTEFTFFTTTTDAPIDNNQQERLLRNPVIGRKTWYGTHSKRGAETTAVLFSIIESCKLNKINPRIYLKAVIVAIHEKKESFTPAEFKILPN